MFPLRGAGNSVPSWDLDMYINEYINKRRVDNEQVIFGVIIKKYFNQTYLIRNHTGQEYINYYVFCNRLR